MTAPRPAPARPRFSLVLPCYNEALTLPSIFSRFESVLRDRPEIEVVFVNNGSRDGSAEVLAAEATRPGRAFARIVTVDVNQGYGFGIMAGLRVTAGDYIGWTHADSQYDPAIMVEACDRLLDTPFPERTFLRGRRVRRGAFDAFFTAGMSIYASLALGVRVRDVNAQPKLFPRSFLDRMEAPPNDFSLDLYALVQARRHGYQLLELPVVFAPRLHGEAKGGGSIALKWKLTRRTLSFIRSLRRDLRNPRA